MRSQGRHSQAEAAVKFAEPLGQPVVIKPRDTDYGNGVALNLMDPAQIRLVLRKAKSYSSDVIVERRQTGDWHRLFVIDNRIVAAVRRVTPRIIGDGQKTVSELIDLLNTFPLRGAGSEFPLALLQVGPTELRVLYHEGLGLDSIPLAGVEVILREDAYLATGATQVDVREPPYSICDIFDI